MHLLVLHGWLTPLYLSEAHIMRNSEHFVLGAVICNVIATKGYLISK